jgi:NAD(P)-dependent dehydrogenase (short-subunit alcohol dehydrogenase family)
MSYNPYSLEGKTILVTGASSGIGQKTAIECSKMGAKLLVVGRNVERLQDTISQLEGEGHSQIVAELTDSEDLTNLVASLPVLDGLVLCAGIGGMTKPLLFCTKESFSNVYEVNVFSTIELLRLLVKKKKMAKESSVVIVSSIGGVRVFNPGNGVYGSSKSAVNSLMKFCAVELAPKKIRVNSVNPGMVHTKLIENGTISDEQQKLDVEKYPLKRYGETIDVALGIIYLLSDASSWVTGHSLVIDGGLTI